MSVDSGVPHPIPNALFLMLKAAFKSLFSVYPQIGTNTELMEYVVLDILVWIYPVPGNADHRCAGFVL